MNVPREIKFNTIAIRFNSEFKEYQVPGLVEKNGVKCTTYESAKVYFTDDRQDAIDTAKAIFGQDILLQVCRVK